MLNKLLISLLLPALLLGGGRADAMPKDFSASYKLSRGSMKIGYSSIELVTDKNGDYTYKSSSWPVRWVGWLLKDKLYETSKGKITTQGIRPDSYSYLRTGGSKEREAKLAFNWEEMTVENNVEDSRWKMDIPAGTLDKLVSLLGMMIALANDQTDISFNIADGGKLKDYRFRVVDEETIEVPAGTFRTVKITRLRDNNKRETYIWCAPELDYLPIRIWQREKDDSEYQSDLEKFSASLNNAGDPD